MAHLWLSNIQFVTQVYVCGVELEKPRKEDIIEKIRREYSTLRLTPSGLTLNHIFYHYNDITTRLGQTLLSRGLLYQQLFIMEHQSCYTFRTVLRFRKSNSPTYIWHSEEVIQPHKARVEATEQSKALFSQRQPSWGRRWGPCLNSVVGAGPDFSHASHFGTFPQPGSLYGAKKLSCAIQACTVFLMAVVLKLTLWICL